MSSTRPSEDFFNYPGSPVKELTPSDFEDLLPYVLKDKSCTFILFYCAWCPHCQNVKEEWKKFGSTAGFVNVAGFNCEKHKEHVMKIKEQMPNLITSYPTLVIYKGGQPKESYLEERNAGSFIKAAMNVCNG